MAYKYTIKTREVRQPEDSKQEELPEMKKAIEGKKEEDGTADPLFDFEDIAGTNSLSAAKGFILKTLVHQYDKGITLCIYEDVKGKETEVGHWPAKGIEAPQATGKVARLPNSNHGQKQFPSEKNN